MGRKVRFLGVPLMKRRQDNRDIVSLTRKVAKQQETISFLLTKISHLENRLRRK